MLPLDKIIEKLTFGKELLSIENHTIEINKKASFTLFSTEVEWTFDKTSILSKSKNSAFLGHPMKGKAIGIYNQGKLVING